MRRSLLKSMGATDRDLEKPLVAIANTMEQKYSRGPIILISLPQRSSAYPAGGRNGHDLHVLAPCDGQGAENVGFKYLLPSRDLIAASVEMMIEHASYDAAVNGRDVRQIIPPHPSLPARMQPSTVWSPVAICLQATTKETGWTALGHF